MVHPGNTDRLDGIFLGMRHVEVTYTGTAAHAAAAPERGYNALDAVVTAYLAVAQVRQHILPTDRVHGIITDGGQAPNMVPHRAAAHFYVRSAGVDSLRHVSARVDAALRGAATATGTTAEFAASTRTPPARDALLDGVIGIAGTVLDVLSDPQVLAAARAEFTETGGPVRWQG